MSAQELASKARKHWAEWLPERTAELKAAGIFGSETMAVAQMAQERIDQLMATGYREHEAEEVALKEYILLPPEKEEPNREAEAREAEYQRMMAPIYPEDDPEDGRDNIES